MRQTSKVVVTGGAGFIGSHLVDELLRRRIETYVIDDLSTGSLENLKHHGENRLLHLIIGDARNIGKFLDNTDGIDVVFHEAAIASVPRSVREPMVVHDANVNMSLEVMNFCVKKKIPRFVFASSAAVYGIIKTERASEQSVCRPYSPYGATKLAVENYLHAYHQTYGLETVALRYFNVFGPRQTLNDYSGVITIFINRLLNKEIPVVYGDGSQTRDFVHVKDIIQANMLAMESQNAAGEMFNVATGMPTSILNLLLVIKSATDASEIEHRFEPPRPGDVKFGLADIDKITSSLGFKPSYDVANGIQSVVDYVRSHSPLRVVT